MKKNCENQDEGDGPECDRCGACHHDMDIYCLEDEDNNPLEFLCVDCFETTPEYEAMCDE